MKRATARSLHVSRMWQPSCTVATVHVRGIAQHHYNLVVIGSGGGAKVASPSHQLGLTVAVAEHGIDSV